MNPKSLGKAVVWIAVAFTPSLALAQSKTSPVGYDASAGNDVLYLGSVDGDTLVIDGTQPASPRLLRGIALRRSSTAQQAGGVKTFEVTLRCGSARLDVIDDAIDKNWTSPPLTTFDRKLVSTPDWALLPISPPAAFDFVLNFDRPFVHTGRDALAIHFAVRQASLAHGVVADGVRVPYEHALGSFGVASCRATGATIAFSNGLELLNGGGGQAMMYVGISVHGAPANAPIVFLLDAVDRQLTVPGLCNSLAAVAVVLPLGAADANGLMRRAYGLPYDRRLEGGSFVTQAATFDSQAAQWIVTNASFARMPSRGAQGLACATIERELGMPYGVVRVGHAPILELR